MLQNSKFEMCKIRCRPLESEALPQGIVVNTSNLETRPLWSDTVKNGNPEPSANLLAVAVGIKQKEIVDQIVKKFPSRDFVVMLFHMMLLWMNGEIWNGVTVPYMCLQ